LLLLVNAQNSSSNSSIRFLIARPNSYEYTVDPQTVWIGSVIESFFYFGLTGIDRVTVVSVDRISGVLPSHRDFTKRISLSKYQNAAKELNADCIVYSEYEVISNKEVILHVTIDVAGGEQNKMQASLPVENMNETLLDLVRQIASAAGIAAGELSEKYMSMSVLGSNAKNIKRLGNYLYKEDDKITVATNAANCERITVEDPTMYLAYYAGSRLYAIAEKNDKAAELIQKLSAKIGDVYPKLYVQLAKNYRRGGKLNEAKSAIDKISDKRNLKYSYLWELGLINEAMGKRADALQNFETLLEIDANDPTIYIYLAKLNLALKNREKSEEYVGQAARITNKAEGKIFFEIGNEFLAVKDNSNAVEAFKKTVELTPDFEEAWKALIDVQIKQGNDTAAALSCLSLFDVNFTKYESYLIKGGQMLEKLGMIEMARSAYLGAYKRYNNPKFVILLAALEFKKQNFEKVKELLVPLGPPWDKDPEVIRMLDKSIEDKTPPEIILNGDDPYIIDAGAGKYYEPGAKAFDDIDGDLTHFVTISGNVNIAVTDTYHITYTVADGSNNKTTKVRTVVVSDDNPPVLELVGPEEIKIKHGEKYVEPGCMAVDTRDGDLTAKIVKSGEINYLVPGTYPLTYTVVDKSGNKVMKTRSIKVLPDENPPVLTLVGSSPLYLKVGERYKEPGARAMDDWDGDLTLKKAIRTSGVVNSMVPGIYKITYTASDKAGNVSTAERVVHIVGSNAKIDKVPPEIRLIGGSGTLVYVGDEFEEPGVNAIDDVDGDITANINIEGDVNPAIPGRYVIKYSVADNSGNKSRRELVILVKEKGENYKRDRVASIYKNKVDETRQRYERQGSNQNLQSKKNTRKILFSVLTGSCGLGLAAIGYYANTLIPKRHAVWEDYYWAWKYEPDDGDGDKARLKAQLDAQQKEIQQTELFRNLCYTAGTLCGVGFTITIFIPSSRNR